MPAHCDRADTCGTCWNEQKTAEYGETDPTKFKCINCNKTGHASWDHTCPKFITACDNVEKTDPEHTYKYFPNDNPWTWEQHSHIGDSTDAGDLFQKATTQHNTPCNPWSQEPYNRWNQEDEDVNWCKTNVSTMQ